MRKCGVPLRWPTWRMVEGSSRETLALTVALKCKMRHETVRRASELLQKMWAQFPPPFSIESVTY